MEITDVRVFPVEEQRVRAYASIVIDDCFIVRDIKVIEGVRKFFVGMPSKKMKDGSFRDIVHPLNSEMRRIIEDAVLEAFEAEMKKARSAEA